MRPPALAAAVFALCALAVNAQTVTTIDELGQTVVEVITIDQQLGLPSTQTLETLTDAVTTTAAATTTQPDGQLGPVGQPPQTVGDSGPTEYTYTTTDVDGNTIAVVDTFTPTFAPTGGNPEVTAPPGTVLDYSSWRKSIGTNTVAVINAAPRQRWSLQTKWLGVGAAVCAGVTGGAWLALA